MVQNHRLFIFYHKDQIKSSKSSHLASWNQQMLDIFALKWTETINQLSQ